MKKYLLLLLPLLAACTGAPEVEIEKKIEYKCGEQIISADFLDDDSMIARVDGINYVLVRVAAADGRRYENTATGMTFMQNGNGTYLTIKGPNYQMCLEIVCKTNKATAKSRKNPGFFHTASRFRQKLILMTITGCLFVKNMIRLIL